MRLYGVFFVQNARKLADVFSLLHIFDRVFQHPAAVAQASCSCGTLFHRVSIALAETYHTMISNQPHQAARSHREALAELERRAGNQVDPALIPLFRDVLKSRQEETGMLLQTGRPDGLARLH